MTLLPVPVAPAELQDNQRLSIPQALADAIGAASEFAAAEKADGTRRAYGKDWQDFAGWCGALSLSALPAEPATVAAYIAARADRLRPSSIGRRLASIRYAHKLAGHDLPTNAETVKAVHRGIRRRLGTKANQKAPATAKAIAAMLKKTPDTLTGSRDRALLLIGFAGALRRSELVGLDYEDISSTADGIFLRIGKSKTDQEGRGHSVPIPNGSRLRPVDALTEWLASTKIVGGPIFRRIRRGERLTTERLTDQSVALIVKKYARAARLDPATFAGHSLRAGFVTSALETGADVFAAADQGRWRKLETVREYDRRAKAFKNHAGKGFL